MEQFTIAVKPSAQNQQVTIEKNQSVDILLGQVKMGDYSYTYKIIKEPQHGELSNERVSYNYLFMTYTPDTYLYGNQDSFQFEVCELGVCSEAATVSINIKN